MSDVYMLQAPTAWAAAPELWSTTTLNKVQACPRRWQLVRSKWGELDRFPAREHPASIEGKIVHDALDRLARACGQRGNPPMGTPGFAEAAAEARFFGGFSAALQGWDERMARHPRPGPQFRLRTTDQELANRTVRLFRAQYQAAASAGAAMRAPDPTAGEPVDYRALLEASGSVSEVSLRHPTLPFVGVIDRIQRTDGTVEIIDFKTGKASDAHEGQLVRYALLWWRNTGVAPSRVVAQYLEGSKAWEISEALLDTAEQGLAEVIEELSDTLVNQPARAVPGPSCRWCPVRARCAEGWAVNEDSARAEGRGDAELTVASEPANHGFLAHDRSGPVAVVYEGAVAALLPHVRAGRLVRVVDAVRRAKGREIEIKAWTELYVVVRE